MHGSLWQFLKDKSWFRCENFIERQICQLSIITHIPLRFRSTSKLNNKNTKNNNDGDDSDSDSGLEKLQLQCSISTVDFIYTFVRCGRRRRRCKRSTYDKTDYRSFKTYCLLIGWWKFNPLIQLSLIQLLFQAKGSLLRRVQV